MDLLITDSRTLSDIQTEFSAEFPFLKIEFFEPSYNGKVSRTSKIYNNSRKVGVCRKMHAEGHIKIMKSDTVAKLEQSFNEKFGLAIQVFRKSGKLWIETTLTDQWTLEQQNLEGQEMTGPVTVKK